MIIKYLLPILALSLVIAFHELGHYLIAKLTGIKVQVFSIGIGKKLISIKKNGTEYAISAIPLGGYCKLKGGDLQNPVMDNDSMDTAHPLKKIFIYIAGPIFNFLFAILLLSSVYLLPVHREIPSRVIPLTGNDLPAEEAGIIKGDTILSIEDYNISNFNDISKALTKSSKTGDKLQFTVERDSKVITLEVTPKTIEGRIFIGVYPFIPLKVLDSNKNNKLQPEDIIIEIDSVTVDNYNNLAESIKDKSLFQLKYLRNGIHETIDYTPSELSKLKFTKTKRYNPLVSIFNGTADTVNMLNKITSLFTDLFRTGEVTKSISSPLRLVYDMGNSINSIYSDNSILFTLQMFLTIIASISLTLGFINILPIPILDGGQILINTAAMIKGSPFKTSIIYGYQTIGLVIVLLLFILGISNDIFYFGDL